MADHEIAAALQYDCCADGHYNVGNKFGTPVSGAISAGRLEGSISYLMV